MTIETVKKELERYLRYAKEENCADVLCWYYTAFGACEMANTLAVEMRKYDLADEISALWSNVYRHLFLMEYRKELESK